MGPDLVEAVPPARRRASEYHGAVYGYGGVLYDLPVGRRLMVTPSLAVGGHVTGEGRNLGHVAEFRSALQVSYRLSDGSRLGLQAQHISNANLGGDENPGKEGLFVTWSPRLGRGMASR